MRLPRRESPSGAGETARIGSTKRPRICANRPGPSHQFDYTERSVTASMSLPWVRLDSNIASHDKILALLSDPSPKRWQAAASYMFALGWSGDHGTDGRIPQAALPFVH